MDKEHEQQNHNSNHDNNNSEDEASISSIPISIVIENAVDQNGMELSGLLDLEQVLNKEHNK